MARIGITARADGGDLPGASVIVSAIASGDNLPISADPDDGPLAQLMPAQYQRFQRLRWLVEIDDVPLQYAQGISWSSSIERPIQGASLAVAGDSERRVGTILPTGAPIGGLKAVDVALVFRQDNGAEFTEPLITNGMVVESPHSYRPGAIVDELEIHDATARVANTRVSRAYAAGSRTPRSTVVRTLADDMGIPSAQRDVPEIGGHLVKAVDLDAGDGLDLAQAIAEVPGWRLLRSRAGLFTARRLAPESEQRDIAWVFTPADWIMSAGGQEYGYDLRATPDAYTRVTVRGSRQVERASDTCQDVTTRTRFETTALYQPEYFPYSQGAGSPPVSYSATGIVAGAAAERTLSETKVWTTERCGALKSQKTETFALRNIQKARVLRDDDAAGTPVDFYDAYVSAQSLDRPGHMYVTDVWMLDSEVFESRFYDGDGFLVRKVTERYGWINPRRAVKERSDVTEDWETATSNVAYRDLGNGTGVQFPAERYLLLERETERYEVRLGQVLGRYLTRQSYGRTPGNLYLYGDGEFGEREESFRVVFEERERWTRYREGVYFKRVEQFGIDGQRDPQLPATFETILGGPPSAEKGDFSGNADRFEQQEIVGIADGSAFLAVRPEHEFGPAVFEYVETQDEAADVAERLLLLSNGAVLTFHIPPNPRVEVGQWVRFIGPPGSGLYHAAKVVETGIRDGDGAPIVQTVVAEIYPELN